MANRKKYLRFRKEWLKIFVEEMGINTRILSKETRREMMRQILRQQDQRCLAVWSEMRGNG